MFKNKFHSFKFLLISLVLFLASSCTEPEVPEVDSGKSITGATEWTIFIYGHADHNLTINMVGDFQEMLASSLNASVKVVIAVDVDSNNAYLEDNSPDPRWTTPGTYVYEILGAGKGGAKLIETRSEENMDDPEILQSHIVNAFTKYPSKKKGVILWNHGGSWDLGFGGDHQNHYSVPANPSYYQGGMTIQQVKSALFQSANTLGLGTTPFDFIAFDTCLMGSIEVAYELRDLAKYYFASAEIDYGAGWNYQQALSYFSSNSSSDITALAPNLISIWDEHHSVGEEIGIMDQLLRTQVAMDLTSLDSFALQFKTFISSSINTSPSKAAKALNRAGPGYNYKGISDLAGPPQSRDIGQFLSILKGYTEFNSEASELLNSAENEVIKAKALGDNRQGFQSGLSIESRYGDQWYNPLNPSSNTTRNNYVTLLWNSGSVWSSFLDTINIMGIFDGAGPSLSITEENLNNPNSSNLPTITFQTADEDINDGLAIIVQNNSGVLIDWGIAASGFFEANEDYSYSWDGKITTLSNGTTASDVALGIFGSPGLDGDGNMVALAVSIWGVLACPHGDFEVKLVGDASPLSTFLIPNSGKWETVNIERIKSLNCSGFTPLIKTSLGYVPSTTLAISTGTTGFDIGERSASAGNYLLSTVIKDVWGNASSNISPVTIVTPF